MFTIHHLNGGTLRPAGGADLVGADELVCHVVALESAGKVTLIDAGLGTADIAAPEERLGAEFCALTNPVLDPSRTIREQLARHGRTSDCVTDVLVTHPDRDHVGGLADFPNARVHLHPAALGAVEGPATDRDRERIRKVQWSHRVRWAPAPVPREAWHGLQAWTLAGMGDDVVMVNLPGHATGHVGYAIRQPEGWSLHAGDAYFHRGAIRGCQEAVPPGLETFESMTQQDGASRYRTRQALAHLPNEVTIFCSHDPVELASFVDASPAGVMGRANVFHKK